MEKSWDTACLWENAEAALAWFEAASDTRNSAPQRSRQYELDGLAVLRAIAKHHCGPHGFIDQAEFGAIRYTEPFLNNQHIVEPTLFHIEHFAEKRAANGHAEWRDLEGNLLHAR